MVITVCIGSSCHLKGSRQIIERLQALIEAQGLKEKVTLKGQFCMGDCLNGVCATLDEEKYSLRPGDVDKFFHDEVLARLS